MLPRVPRFAASTLAAAALLAAAAPTATAQQRPPIRPLGPVVATSAESLGNVTAVRALSGGRALVNDAAKRRLLLVDSALATVAVVVDSSGGATAYGPRPGGLIPYRGDSTLFVDPAGLSMLVVDPAGRIARVMSVPRAQDAMWLVGFAGTPGFDAAGRLVYRGNNRVMMRRTPGEGPPQIPPQPDSAPIVRVDLASRTLDTAAFVRTPKINMQVTRTDEGRFTVTSEVNPLPVVDEWAVLADGSIAIVRGRDYHVDWIGADGSLTSSPKIPFDWQRLTDEDKVAFIDSVKAVRERMAAADTGSEGAPGGGHAAPGAQQTIVIEERAMAGRPGGPGGGRDGRGGAARMRPNITFVAASELPDYKPPFFAGSLRVDPSGNLWILTIPTVAIPGGPVYDVVNRAGELVERVQLPAGRTIAGFGAAGDVYLLTRTADGVTLERARVR